ncbi:MAG: maturation protein [Sanya levivirus 5]|nr:MAG: maturation protein [Sanya levivirus 5]
MSRVRRRGPLTAEWLQGYTGTPGTLYTGFSHREVISESSFPGPCNVNHYRIDAPLQVSMTQPSYWIRASNLYLESPTIPVCTKLNWGKLPTSTAFGLIQFFAELDDMLAMFAMRFWKQLSYGSFTWGVMPFVSELKNLLEAIKNLSASLDDFSYEDSFEDSFPIDITGSMGPWSRVVGKLHVKYHLTGRADISFQHPISVLLDRLGFHPDLATAWDLVPLSFVVDWLLPVGDFLDSLKGGGWVKVAMFNGWQSAKWSREVKVISAEPQASVSSSIYRDSGYSRYNSAVILSIPPTIDPPVLQIPSFRQIFNMLYLAGLGKRLRF